MQRPYALPHATATSDWEAAFRVDALHNPTGAPLPRRFRPRLRLAWNENALLLRLDVAQRDPPVEADSAALWEKDSVEIFTNPPFHQFVIAPGIDPRHSDPRTCAIDHTPAADSARLRIDLTRERTPSGYRLTITLPWANTGTGCTPRVGTVFGLQMIVSKILPDGARLQAALFPRTTTAINPHCMQRVRLARRASPPVTRLPAPLARHPHFTIDTCGLVHPQRNADVGRISDPPFPSPPNGRNPPSPRLRRASRFAAYVGSRGSWMQQAGWGVFCHYLAGAAGGAGGPLGNELSADAWNRRVDGFDVSALGAQLESVGARYFFLTLGQNSGHYCAPNATYDAIVGTRPSLCSRRDLIADLAAELTRRGIRLCVYATSGAPQHDPVAMKAFGMTALNTHIPGAQSKWLAVCREWSERWGRNVHAWWIDGCYSADVVWKQPTGPNFTTFAAALRAGNPDALLAFNPAQLVPVIRQCPEEDFTAGELDFELPACPGPRVAGAQWHVLTFLGSWWGHGAPRFTTGFVRDYTEHIRSRGGVITWDAPIQPNGRIPDAFLLQLRTARS